MFEAQLWLPGPHHDAPQLLASPHKLGLINPSLLPGQAAETSQELLQHLHQEVCDASKVLGIIQEDRDSQQHHLQELAGAVISLQHPLEACKDLPLLGWICLTRKQKKAHGQGGLEDGEPQLPACEGIRGEYCGQ